MVLFFIADLALTLAFKLSTWCLGKTYNGIVYLVTYNSKPPKPNTRESVIDDDCTDDCTDDFVTMTMSRQEYDALKQSHDLNHPHPHASSEDELVSKDSSSSECASSK